MADLIPNFHGDIVTPSDPTYTSAIARWAGNTIRRAKVVTFPKDQDDVALAIAYAKSHNLPLAIRGGGHNPAGAASVEDGLVIDLSRHFNGVRVDPENKRAYVGGGALWDTVDQETIKHGLATVAGTVSHTGVGGLTLGGGYGYLTGEHGLALDNLVEATVITASGIPHTASETVNPDLFFGIRGGGCNFGVVTEFVFQLHPQRPTVFFGMLFYPKAVLEVVVDVTKKWYEGASEKEGIIQATTLTPDGQAMIAVTLFYNGSEEEGKAAFKAFYDLPYIPLPDGPRTPTPRDRPYADLNRFMNSFVAYGNGSYFKGFAHKSPHYPSISLAFDHLIKTVSSSVSPQIHGVLIFEYFPLLKVNAIPNGASAFRRDPTPAVLVVFHWDSNPENGHGPMVERARTAAYEISDIIGKGQEGVSSQQKLGYSNYDSAAGELDKAKAAFGENYPKLQGIKRKYDPDNIFNKWFPITPA